MYRVIRQLKTLLFLNFVKHNFLSLIISKCLLKFKDITFLFLQMLISCVKYYSFNLNSQNMMRCT